MTMPDNKGMIPVLKGILNDPEKIDLITKLFTMPLADLYMALKGTKDSAKISILNQVIKIRLENDI